MEGLNHATGFLQARVAARLQTRFTPVLSFQPDDSVKKSVEIGRLIDEAVASDQKGEASPRGLIPAVATEASDEGGDVGGLVDPRRRTGTRDARAAGGRPNGLSAAVETIPTGMTPTPAGPMASAVPPGSALLPSRIGSWQHKARPSS